MATSPSEAARVSPRCTSTTYEIAWKVKKRDADRQHDLKQRQRRAQPDPVQRVVRRAHEEPQVLERCQQPEVEARSRPTARAGAPSPTVTWRSPAPANVLTSVDPDEQQHPARVDPPVEEVRHGEDERAPQPRMRHEQPRQHEHDHEERGELDRGEGHLRESFPGDPGGPAACPSRALSARRVEGRSARSRPARELPSGPRPAARDEQLGVELVERLPGGKTGHKPLTVDPEHSHPAGEHPPPGAGVKGAVKMNPAKSGRTCAREARLRPARRSAKLRAREAGPGDT